MDISQSWTAGILSGAIEWVGNGQTLEVRGLTLAERNPYVAWFPRDGAILHYHFARLNLCSYILRGLSAESISSLSVQAKEFAELAISSATAVIELVLDREDLRNALVGMPVYFHGMITFAAVFLIKTTKMNVFSPNNVDAPRIVALVQRCVEVFQAQSAAGQHMIYHLGRGLDALLKASEEIGTTPAQFEGVHFTDDLSSAVVMDSMFLQDPFDPSHDFITRGMDALL